MRFAMLEMKAVLFALLKSFKFSATEDTPKFMEMDPKDGFAKAKEKVVQSWKGDCYNAYRKRCKFEWFCRLFSRMP